MLSSTNDIILCITYSSHVISFKSNSISSCCTTRSPCAFGSHTLISIYLDSLDYIHYFCRFLCRFFFSLFLLFILMCFHFMLMLQICFRKPLNHTKALRMHKVLENCVRLCLTNRIHIDFDFPSSHSIFIYTERYTETRCFHISGAIIDWCAYNVHCECEFTMRM